MLKTSGRQNESSRLLGQRRWKTMKFLTEAWEGHCQGRDKNQKSNVSYDKLQPN